MRTLGHLCISLSVHKKNTPCSPRLTRQALTVHKNIFKKIVTVTVFQGSCRSVV